MQAGPAEIIAALWLYIAENALLIAMGAAVVGLVVWWLVR